MIEEIICILPNMNMVNELKTREGKKAESGSVDKRQIQYPEYYYYFRYWIMYSGSL